MSLKKIIPFVLLAFLLYRFPMASFRLGYELSALYISTTIFSLYIFSKGYKIEALFMLLCIFHSYYPACTLRSISALKILAIGMFLYFVLCEIRIDFNLTLSILCVYCLAHISFLVLRHFDIEALKIYGLMAKDTGIGLTANPNEASALIALCTPAFMRKKWILFAPVIIAGLVLSRSFGGFLAVSAIFLYILYGYNKKLSIVLFLAGIVSFYIFVDAPGMKRFSNWSSYIKFWFQENILFGFGHGHFQYISKKFCSVSDTLYLTRAHNTFLQQWIELGWLFVPLLAMYVKKIYDNVKGNNILTCAAISIFLVCCANSAFRINALNGIIIIVWLHFMRDKIQWKYW